MSFFEFVEQIAFIIKNLPISFWISVAIVSPLFMKFEGLVQTGLTKILYFVFIRFPKKYPKLLSFLGFSSQNMYQQLQELHGQYENEKNISEKLEISEDFLDETRGGMFVYNELSDIIFGERTNNLSEKTSVDNNYFDYDVISKMEFTIKELKEINKNQKPTNNNRESGLLGLDVNAKTDGNNDEPISPSPRIAKDVWSTDHEGSQLSFNVRGTIERRKKLYMGSKSSSHLGRYRKNEGNADTSITQMAVMDDENMSVWHGICWQVPPGILGMELTLALV